MTNWVKKVFSDINKRKMTHHHIFHEYRRMPVVGTGKHLFDFLGVATKCNYKKGLEKHVLKPGERATLGYPTLNEHYFDWIALLSSVANAGGIFRMAELGAGWGPWLVRGAFAVNQKNTNSKIELLGIEADPTHFQWMNEHFIGNGLIPSDHSLIMGAVSAKPETLKFPRLTHPDEDYGASTRLGSEVREFIQVQGYTLENLINRFTGTLDFLHMDVQGAEYDLLPTSIKLLSASVKNIMIGTHMSTEKHESVYSLFNENDWKCEYVFPRNQTVNTEFGIVSFGDGFQWWSNPQL
jgi:FkbM family methyltransferase